MTVEQVPLSSFDHWVPTRWTPCYQIIPLKDQELAISTLNQGLRVTCQQFPYLKGCIYLNEDGTHFGVRWSSSDLPVQMKETSAPPHINIPSYDELVAQRLPLDYFTPLLLPAFSIDRKSDGTGAVFAVNYVRITGGLIIASVIHHKVTDGTGMGTLLTQWAENCRAIDQDAVSDHIIEEVSNREADIQAALPSIPEMDLDELSARHPELGLGYGSATSARDIAGKATVPCTSTMLAFSCEKLNALRLALANDREHPLVSPPSINVILCALLWQRITKSRQVRLDAKDPDQFQSVQSSLGMAADVRRQASLGLKFMGNMVLHIRTTLSFADVVGPSSRVPEKPSSYPPTVPILIKALEETMFTQRTPHKLAEIHRILTLVPNLSRVIWPFNHGRDVLITSWANLSMYNDFGPKVGKVEWVRGVKLNGIDGLVWIFPRKRISIEDSDGEKGGGGRGIGTSETVEVLIALREDDLQDLVDDEFMKTLLV